MEKIYKQRKLLNFLVLVAFFSISGCVDTSGPVIPSSINYMSEMKIVNLVQGSGSTSLVLNDQSLGNVDFASEYPAGNFLSIPSGNKALKVTFSGGTTKTFQFPAATEYKFRVFLYGTTSESEMKVVTQRYIWQTKNSKEGAPLFPENKTQVCVFNASTNALLNQVIVGNDTASFPTPLGLGSSSPYLMFNGSSTNIKLIYNDTVSVTINTSLQTKSRYTLVTYDDGSAVNFKVFTDD